MDISVRTYVPQEYHNRVVEYARRNNITLQKAYELVISGVLDTGGVMKNALVLTEPQYDIILDIAKDLQLPTEQVVTDLINYAILVYGTNVTLQDVLKRAAPIMMDSLVQKHPRIAKEILLGLK